ncbi:MAG: AraC family transcriptional regulator [Spirochaetaceae bacterium]
MKLEEYADNPGTAFLGAFAEVLHAGFEKCRPKHYTSIPRDHYLLHLVLSGSGRLRVGSEYYTLRSRECFLIRPHQDHAYQADASSPWEYLWLGFAGVTDEVLRDIYGIPENAPAFKPASPARLEFHMRRILAALGSGNPLEQLYSRALGVLALGCLGERTGVGTQGSQTPDYVEEAVSYIESQYAQLGNAQSVAEYVGLDRSYFSKIFQERTGISVARFLAETRMSHAKRLLVDTDYKIKAISTMVGYENYQSFERRFTAVVGMSPSAFRNRPMGERVKVGAKTADSTGSRVPTASVIASDAPEAHATEVPHAEYSDLPTESESASSGDGESRPEPRSDRSDSKSLLRGAAGRLSHMRHRTKRE